MNKFFCALILFLMANFLFVNFAYTAAAKPKDEMVQAMAIDIDKDGEADVVYYFDDENINMAEADINKDGMPDVRVYAQNGKFKSAEADTDYDGKVDKKFTNASDFGAWLNQNNPELEDYLNRPNWKKTMFNF